MSYFNKFHLATPAYWPAWIGVSFLWLITRLPWRWQLAIGNRLGTLLYLLPSRLKHITEVNIKLCFPDISSTKQKELVKESFKSLGVGLIEAAMSWWVPDDKLQNIFHVHGLEYAEQAFAKGKGVILLGPHFTSLEMIGRLLGMKYSFAVMFRPHKKRIIAFIHERFRKKQHVQYIPRHRVRQLIRALNNNVAVWYAYDVDGGEKRSVFAPFFGIPTASLTSVSRIVRMSDAAVVPISFFRREGKFEYDVTLYPPLENFPTDNLHTDATQLNAALEHAIRQKPGQYIWQYKRFKTRPKGEARFY